MVNDAQVSSLRAFFEQQGNGAGNTPTEKNESANGNGAAGKPRVKSSFISVGTASNFSSLQQKVAPFVRASPLDPAPVETVRKEAPQAVDVPKDLPKSSEPEVPEKEEETKTTPALQELSAKEERKPSPERRVNGSKAISDKEEIPSITKEKESIAAPAEPPAPRQTPKQALKPERTVSPPEPSTPKKIPVLATPKTTPTSKKPVAPQSTQIPRPTKTPLETAPAAKTPPTKTTAPAKSSPTPKNVLGPNSPTKSVTSTRRSSSPFLVTPPGLSKSAPQKDSPKTAKTTRSSLSNTKSRRESTPKSSIPPAKPTTPLQTSTSSSKPFVKVSPSAIKPLSTPRAPPHALMRPRSAQSNLSPPSSSRRFVSQPPRPATSASHKSSPRLNRASSLHNLPKTKTDVPPVPTMPRPAVTTGDGQDYSHLPTFMRPTQASSAKVVARPGSAMEKHSRTGEFRV